jgi:putative flippase GtrA
VTAPAHGPLQKLGGELVRFVLIGLSTAALDFCIYRGLWTLGLPIHLAKGIGFAAGTTYAYFANRAVTFRLGAGWRRQELPRFLAVYAGAMLANIAANYLILSIIGRSEAHIAFAFVVAACVSAATTFAGMKLFVFRAVPPAP